MLGKYPLRYFLEVIGGESLTGPPVRSVREKTREVAAEGRGC